jgi:hypothetical protein
LRAKARPACASAVLAERPPATVPRVRVFRFVVVGFAVGLLSSTVSSCVDLGPACGPTTCKNGCCTDKGLCVAGSFDATCGANGAQCAVCSAGNACQAGVCRQGGSGGGSATGGGAGATGGGTTGGSVTITGHVTYDFVPSKYLPTTGKAQLDFAHTVAKPVRNGVVQVRNANALLGSAVTGADGSFSVSFNPSGGALTLYALAKTSAPAIQVVDNTDGKLLWTISAPITSTQATQTIDLRASSGWTGTGYDATKRAAAPFAVLDSMYTATQAFLAVRQVTFPALQVNWSPNNVPEAGMTALGKIGTSHFSPQENEIYVLGKEGVDTDEFDAHVIVHEWGHYFEANLSRSDSPGGRHGAGDVLDPRIAFGEAWGNSVASMVLPESAYSDTSWNGATMTGFGFDLEAPPEPPLNTDDPTPSGFSESSVMRILYDLYDPANESFDQLALGLGPLIDVLTGPQRTTDSVTTLAAFITELKAQPGVNAAAIDTLLAHSSIGSITSIFGAGDTGLASMFVDATALPFTGSVPLGGGFAPNTYQQNQYYVFKGTGGTITVSANSTEDVAIAAYRQGRAVGSSDATTSGTERFTFASQANVIYVLVLTGFGATQGDYTVSVSIQ